MNSDRNILRRQLDGLRSGVSRASRDRPGGDVYLGLVTGLGPSGATGPKTIGTYPARLTTTETPGGLVNVDYDYDATQLVPVALTRGTVQDGDLLDCRLIDGRWAAEMDGSPDRPDCDCGGTHTVHVALSDTGQVAQYAIAILRLDGVNIQSRIVNAAGDAVFAISPRRPCGEWSIKVCLWGFEPEIVVLDGDCPEEGGTTNVVLDPITGGITMALTDANGTWTAALTEYTWPAYTDPFGNLQPAMTAYGWQWCYEKEVPMGSRVQFPDPPVPYIDPQELCTIATDGSGNPIPITTAFGYDLYFFPKVGGLYQLSPKFGMRSWFARCFWYYETVSGYAVFPNCSTTIFFGEATCGDWDPQDRNMDEHGCPFQRFSNSDETMFGFVNSNNGNSAGFCRPYSPPFAFPFTHVGGTLYDPADIGGILGSAPILLSEV